MTDLWIYIFAAAIVTFALATYTALRPQTYLRAHNAKVYSVTEGRKTERRVKSALRLPVAGLPSYVVEYAGGGYAWIPCRRNSERRDLTA